MLEPPAEPPAQPSREGPIARWLTTGWCLLAGALLSVSPHSPVVWEQAFGSARPLVRDLMMSDPSRWGIAGFGVVLLAAGAWDVSTFIVQEIR